MKTTGTLLYSLISATLAAVVIQFFVGNWNEEYLNYSLSEPQQVAKNLQRQNIELRNSGVDPATNVKVYVRPFQSGEVPRIAGEFDSPGNGAALVGGFERVRRKEVVTLTATFTSGGLSDTQIQIKSDRSIAEYKEKAPWPYWSWWPGIGTFLLVYIFLAVAIPARRGYLEAAQLAKEAVERKRKE